LGNFVAIKRSKLCLGLIAVNRLGTILLKSTIAILVTDFKT